MTTNMIDWKYSGEPDVDFSEHNKFNPKILIILVVFLFVIGLGIFGFLKRNFIIDLIKNPKFQLTSSELILEVGNELDYSSVVGENNWPDRYEIVYPDDSLVDINTLGEYTLPFILKTSATENVTNLIVKVEDHIAPEIELSQDEIIIARGSEEAETFNPENYIKELKDNYDKKEDLYLIYNNINTWDVDSIEIVYSVTDKSNNSTNKTLKVIIEDKVEEVAKEEFRLISEYLEVHTKDGNIIIISSKELLHDFIVDTLMTLNLSLAGVDIPENGTWRDAIPDNVSAEEINELENDLTQCYVYDEIVFYDDESCTRPIYEQDIVGVYPLTLKYSKSENNIDIQYKKYELGDDVEDLNPEDKKWGHETTLIKKDNYWVSDIDALELKQLFIDLEYPENWEHAYRIFTDDSIDLSKLAKKIEDTIKEEKVEEEKQEENSMQSQQNSQPQETSQNTSQESQQTYQPPRGHYIDGTHDISIKKGTTFDQLVSLLISGVSSDEEIQVLYGEITTDALNTPGKYQVVYKTNSLSKTITVTVYE